MNFPLAQRLENPILQELAATGGTEDVRFLYEKLIAYFPALDESSIANGNLNKWRVVVQRAGKELDTNGLITRTRGIWSLTKRGKTQVETEIAAFEIIAQSDDNRKMLDEISHRAAQEMLIEIAQILGFEAQMEFEFYDVVWRTSAKSTRLSHVFEVQHRGNIDSAFAKLKKAHDAQRSKVFLILSSERDTNRALRSMSDEKNGAFHELSEIVTILSFAQLQQIHKSLTSIKDFLPIFLDK